MNTRMKMAAVTCALMLVLGTAALAHEQDQRGRNQGRNASARDHGYQIGYRDGGQHARGDRSSGRGSDYRNADYQRGERGYERWMGNKGQYKQGYRDGYRAGYEQAYNGGGWGNWPGRGRGRNDDVYTQPYPRYPGGSRGGARDDPWGRNGRGGDNNIAHQTGYAQGLRDGREDRDDRKSFKLDRHGDYKKATDGYRKEYGNKDLYKNNYRAGYQRGYQQGYYR